MTRKRPKHALSDVEQQTVLATLQEPRFVDVAPPQVDAQLLEEGRYLCSIRTRYRLRAAHQEVRERRAVASHPGYTQPEWLATRARRLIAESGGKQNIVEDQRTLPADRGSSMKSKAVALLRADLGVTKTQSRPHVSNDNPFSESPFQTRKYRPEFPERFGCIQDARAFGCVFFPWYNREHRHSGVALYTPSDVHYGRVQQVHQRRQAALDAAYQRAPNRFVHKPPEAALPPQAVWIHPPKDAQTQVIQ